MHHRERQHRAAAHAAAHDVGALDLEMVQQSLALRHVLRPGHALDPAARRPAFAPVEQDAGVFFRQMVDELDLGVDAERRPFLDRGVEAAGRVHQQRRSGARDLVAGGDAVDDRGRHISSTEM